MGAVLAYLERDGPVGFESLELRNQGVLVHEDLVDPDDQCPARGDDPTHFVEGFCIDVTKREDTQRSNCAVRTVDAVELCGAADKILDPGACNDTAGPKLL